VPTNKTEGSGASSAIDHQSTNSSEARYELDEEDEEEEDDDESRVSLSVISAVELET
jgi:hypothetical protein